MKFTHTDEDYTVTLKLHKQDLSLDEVLKHFEYFLKGCSYVIDSDQFLSLEKDL